MWKRLYAESGADKGTLHQLKHLLNRTNVPPNPQNNMNAADDFIRVVLIGHVIALVMMHFGMQMMHDMPTHADLQMINDESSDVFKQRHFHQALANMLRQHINPFTTECFGTCSSAAEDGVQMYAHELLSLGLLYSEFRDGIRVMKSGCFYAGSSFC